MNISSIVVQVPPSHLEDVVTFIKKSELWEYHLHDEKGRIIVVIEGENIEEEIHKLQSLQAVEHVTSAEMVFSFSGDELEQARGELDNNTEIPDFLNNPNAELKDIRYSGDLKGRY